MLDGIDIRFYEPGQAKRPIPGKLFLKEEGNFIEFPSRYKRQYLEPIPIAFAKTVHTREKYTLVNCIFSSGNLTYSRYSIGELYKGRHLEEVTNTCYTKIQASMTFLSGWMNHSRLKPIANKQIELQDAFFVAYILNKNLSLELREYYSGSFDRSGVSLTNKSDITIKSNKELSRLELYQHVDAFQKLLFLFVEGIPKIKTLSLSGTKAPDVELVIAPKLYKTVRDENHLVSFDYLQPFWEKAMLNYYGQRKKFVQTLNLLLESHRSKTAEISFLNVTTAFEIFHKSFLQNRDTENDRIRVHKELWDEGIIQDKRNKWSQIMRYYHLTERVRDLPYFKRVIPDQKKLIQLLRDSRNYYTHYSETSNTIWTVNQLFYINRELQLLLKALVLQKLQFPDELINQLMNSNAHWLYHDYESNPYSLHYIRKR